MTNIHDIFAGGRRGGAVGDPPCAGSQFEVRLPQPDIGCAGATPEELFAAGWLACFEGAMRSAARRIKVSIPHEMVVDAEVDLRFADGEYLLTARLNVNLPGVPYEAARDMIDAAHRTCPYSKAICGKIDVTVTLL